MTKIFRQHGAKEKIASNELYYKKNYTNFAYSSNILINVSLLKQVKYIFNINKQIITTFFFFNEK